MSDAIEVTSGGPIEGTFKIDLSPGPGAYEFRGQRGSGKTTLISSIDWLAGHKVDVTLHDGALSGRVEGFGVVAPIGGRKRRKGSMDLDTLEAEKFSLVDVIDPPGKTPEVRDSHVIKALVAFSGVKAEPKLYYEVAGGQAAFDQLGIANTDDPVLLATRVKQAFDKLARERTNTAEAEEKHAAPLEVVPDGLDMTNSCDLDELGAARDAARDESKSLADSRESGIRTEQAVAKAKEQLATVKYDGPTVKEATAAANEASSEVGEAAKVVDDLERQLLKAKQSLESLKAEESLLLQKIETAGQHEHALAALNEIATQDVSYPAAGEISDAQAAVAVATEAYNQGIRIRDVRQNQAKALRHREAAESARKAAAEVKNKAGQVFDILARSIDTQHISIEPIDGEPRLFVQHPKRGKTAFDRVNGLSDGERVDFALRELLPHIESPGLLPIPQRVWQDLQPSDRKHLHVLAVERKLFLFGAEVDDGDLRVVYLGNGGE